MLKTCRRLILRSRFTTNPQPIVSPVSVSLHPTITSDSLHWIAFPVHANLCWTASRYSTYRQRLVFPVGGNAHDYFKQDIGCHLNRTALSYYSTIRSQLDVDHHESTLKIVLNFTDKEVKTFFKRMEKSDQYDITDRETFVNICKLMADNHIPKTDILKFCQKLYCTSFEKLQERFNHLKQTNVKITLGNVIGSTSDSKEQVLIEDFQLENQLTRSKRLIADDKVQRHQKIKEKNKIFYTHKDSTEQIEKLLQTKLGLDDTAIGELFKRFKRFKNVQLSNIDPKLELLLKHDIPPEDIVKNPLVLLKDKNVIEERLNQLYQLGITNKAIRYISSSNNYLFKCLSLLKADKEILGECKTTREFLVKYLECKESDIERMVKHCRNFLSTNLPKLKGRIDFIVKELNLPKMEIVKNPRILSNNDETVIEKVKQLKDNELEVKVQCLAFQQLFLSHLNAATLRKTEKEVLGESETKQKFLCKYLECKEADIDKMEKKCKGFLSRNSPKLKRRIDFIVKELNLPKMTIVKYPEMFGFSDENLIEKVKHLKDNELEVKFQRLRYDNKTFLVRSNAAILRKAVKRNTGRM